jgi:hypothetical protein
MEAGKNSVIYMGLISGQNKADDTCGKTTVTGTRFHCITNACKADFQHSQGLKLGYEDMNLTTSHKTTYSRNKYIILDKGCGVLGMK